MLTHQNNSPSFVVVVTAGIFSIVAAAITNPTGFEYVKVQARMMFESIFFNRHDHSDVDKASFVYPHKVSGNETAKPFQYKSPFVRELDRPFQPIIPQKEGCAAP